MKHFTILLVASLFFVFFSCNNQAEDQTNTDTDDKAQIEDSDKKNTEPIEEQVKTIVVNEPTTVNINDIKKGSEFFGLTVAEVKITNEKTFTFTIPEEFILEGSVEPDAMEAGIYFSIAEPTRSNAVLEFGDMEKPFFLAPGFNNEEELMSALTDEQKQELNNNMQASIPLRIKVKNYRVGADAENFWIGASADFVEIVE